MSDIDVRRTLPLHLTWMLAFVITWVSWQVAQDTGLGADSHAYWAIWQGERRASMYDIAPGSIDAFNYSPVFALAVWPLVQLPWPVFGVLWSATALAACCYLIRPLGWRWVAPLMLCASPELLSGNIFWLLALTAVWGLRSPPMSGAWWSLAALTKVTVALGPVWFAVRREWRPLGGSIAVTGALVLVTWLATPALWQQWVAFLFDNEASTSTVGSSVLPPLVWRLPVAVVLTAWGAHTGRAWTVPIAMVLATPVAGPAAFVMLAAIPRLLLEHRGPHSRT